MSDVVSVVLQQLATGEHTPPQLWRSIPAMAELRSTFPSSSQWMRVLVATACDRETTQRITDPSLPSSTARRVMRALAHLVSETIDPSLSARPPPVEQQAEESADSAAPESVTATATATAVLKGKKRKRGKQKPGTGTGDLQQEVEADINAAVTFTAPDAINDPNDPCLGECRDMLKRAVGADSAVTSLVCCVFVPLNVNLNDADDCTRYIHLLKRLQSENLYSDCSNMLGVFGPPLQTQQQGFDVIALFEDMLANEDVSSVINSLPARLPTSVSLRKVLCDKLNATAGLLLNELDSSLSLSPPRYDPGVGRQIAKVSKNVTSLVTKWEMHALYDDPASHYAAAIAASRRGAATWLIREVCKINAGDSTASEGCLELLESVVNSVHAEYVHLMAQSVVWGLLLCGRSVEAGEIARRCNAVSFFERVSPFANTSQAAAPEAIMQDAMAPESNAAATIIEDAEGDIAQQQSLPVFTFKDSVTVVDDPGSLVIMRSKLQRNIGARTVALDCEWTPDTLRLPWDTALSPPAILQIAVENAAGVREAFVVRLQGGALNDSDVEEVLVGLFSAKGILKLGFGFEQDMHKLGKLYPKLKVSENIRNFKDLSNTQLEGGIKKKGRNFSLAALTRAVLGVDLDKASRLSDWSRWPLRVRALTYAAADVLVLLEVNKVLSTNGKVKRRTLRDESENQ